MQARLKSLHSPDADLKSFVPADPASFSVLVQMFVGATGSDAEESFDTVVCTIGWFADHYRNADLVLLRHVILVREYSYEKLYSRLRAVVEVARDETWAEIAERVGRVGLWELEDMKQPP